MADQLPLPALLSQALVAFTIESDNEFEHRMPHRTTRHGEPGDRGPWLVSMAMWFNCMQFVTGEGHAGKRAAAAGPDRDWSRTRTTGGPMSGHRRRCRTTRWSCTGAATPTAARLTGDVRSIHGDRRDGNEADERPTFAYRPGSLLRARGRPV